MTDPGCPNCGTDVVGRYCPDCGQRQDERLLPPLRVWIAELLDELLFVEGRLPATLRALARPGEATAKWMEGKRAAFTHPLRVYLLAALPFFLLVAQPDLERPSFEGGEGFLTYIVSTGLWLRQAPVRAPPMEPLSAEAARDSAARAEWTREFERRRAQRRESVEIPTNRGIRRVFGLLPTIVGLVMVPVLALGLAARGFRGTPFVARMVFSLHLHAVGYVLGLLGAVIGLGIPLVMGGIVLYAAAAFRRVFGTSWPTSTLRALVTAVVYVGVFFVLYTFFVMALAWIVPDWLYGAG